MFDTHTHVYPDAIGPKIARNLHSLVGDAIPLSGDFTIADIKAYMARCGVEAIITFCVADRAEAVYPANQFLIEITDNQTVFGFGTILPDMDNPVEEVRRIHGNGLRGIKFHSLFQPLGAADENLHPIYEEIVRKGMIAYFHVGKDPANISLPARTSPRDIALLKDRYPDMKIVAAHLGGYLMLEEAQKWIIGKDIYIDTCWCPNVLGLDSEEVSRLIRDHGIEKVLFGTDYPSTTDPGPQIEWIRNLDLNTKEKECIFHDNARRLLGL